MIFRTLPASRILLALLLLAPGVRGQESLILNTSAPGGLRSSVTEAWGTFRISVSNEDAVGRPVRVLVLYPGTPDKQFGRDLWVPAHSRIEGWLPVGPAAAQTAAGGREVQILLYDRTDGRDRLVLPGTDERVRSRAVAYRKREATTALFMGDQPITRSPSGADEPPVALMFTHALRLAGGLPEHVSIVPNGLLPPMAAAFDAIDHLVIAGGHLEADPAGLAAIRHWVQLGGKVLVMLDRVGPEIVQALLGDEPGLDVVDRVSLTTILLSHVRGEAAAAKTREFDRPVEFVRVLPATSWQTLHEINGWPASLTRRVGRGKIIVTTIGAAAWHRPRTESDRAAPYIAYPNLPVPLDSLGELAAELRPRATHPFTVDDMRPLLTEEIGYSVVDLRVAAAILGAFALTLIALGIALRRSRRPELVGWFCAAAALVTAGLFVVLGEQSRRAVPPTVAVAEVVDALPGAGEAAVNGVAAIFRPESGLANLGAGQGALLDIDEEGLEGQIRRRVQTDLDDWQWDRVSLPAGVRGGPLRYTARAKGLSAVARFGSNGIEGRLNGGPYQNLADGIFVGPAREPIALKLGTDGAFSADVTDQLIPGQFIAGTVLSDRQQRRQDVYRKLLTGTLPEHLDGRNLLLAWAELGEIPVIAAEGTRRVGTSLLILPLAFERPAPGTRVTVPSAFLPYMRFTRTGLNLPTMDGTLPADMRLRFQIPSSLQPLTLEKATLVAKLRTPGRKITISGLVGEQMQKLFEGVGPVEPVRLEIADPSMLQLDKDGGLHVNLTIGSSETEAGGKLGTNWKIDSLTLIVTGRTAAP